MLLPELQTKMLQLLDSEISFDEFEDWYIPLLPELLENGESSIKIIVGAIELALSELESGIISEDEFQKFLSGFLGDTIITYDTVPDNDQSISFETGSSNILYTDAETSVCEVYA